MTVATRVVDLHLLTWSGVVRCRFDPGERQANVVAINLEGENMRSLLVDPFNPRHLYAASVTDVYSSEDGGDTFHSACQSPGDVRALAQVEVPLAEIVVRVMIDERW